ncbi:MAG: isocitrate lyase/PEP mutase family protein [Halocynthiibacter sp.]
MTDIGRRFRNLHQKGNPFILANAWDVGSAKMLCALGADAIATSSAAHAFTLGRKDMGDLTRDEALAHAQDLVAAVPVPVSGDFENGFGHDPDTVAETVRLSAEIGLAGISIEDSNLPATTPYDFDLAVERIKAASAAARALPDDFVLVARADGIMNGQYDIEEALKRLKAFEAAGADCLYAPLPATPADLTRICREIDAPVNALAAGSYTAISRAEFAKMGVARISLGSALARVTHRAVFDAANAMFQDGDFSPLSHGISGDVVEGLFDDL